MSYITLDPLEVFVKGIPNFLSETQRWIVLRDISRTINYFSPEVDVATITDQGLLCEGWKYLPGWLRRFELRDNDQQLEIRVCVEASVRREAITAMLSRFETELSSLFAYPIRPFPKRVFCIGWHKTGTTSLTEALRVLGLFSWHFAPWVIGVRHQTDEVSLAPFDFSDIADYTAVSDLPVCALFRELNEAFSGSLFILTTRDIDAWIESASNLAANIISHYGSLDSVMRWAYGIDTIDQKIFRDRFTRHQNEVLEYFGDRKNLLVIDVTRGNPWTALCDFLGVPDPSVPFPHLNRRPPGVPAS